MTNGGLPCQRCTILSKFTSDNEFKLLSVYRPMRRVSDGVRVSFYRPRKFQIGFFL